MTNNRWKGVDEVGRGRGVYGQNRRACWSLGQHFYLNITLAKKKFEPNVCNFNSKVTFREEVRFLHRGVVRKRHRKKFQGSFSLNGSFIRWNLVFRSVVRRCTIIDTHREGRKNNCAAHWECYELGDGHEAMWSHPSARWPPCRFPLAHPHLWLRPLPIKLNPTELRLCLCVWHDSCNSNRGPSRRIQSKRNENAPRWWSRWKRRRVGVEGWTKNKQFVVAKFRRCVQQ